jgi:hypothetical protein
MMRLTCAREKEVAEMLSRGHWPQACPAELRAHVDGCRACGDLVLVTQTFQGARAETVPPRLASAGALWWRAQLRRRNEAIERIGRPILGAQIFALAAAVVLGLGAIGWEMRRGFNLEAWIADLPRALHLDALLPESLPTLEGNLWLLVPLAATLALVSGVIVYLAREKQ